MKTAASALGKRERQIMEIIYRRSRATAAEVLSDLPDPPTYTAVRGMLRHLEAKGLLKHDQQGPRYVYSATAPVAEVRDSALSHLVTTFFGGSTPTVVAALLSSKRLSQEEYERLSALLEQAYSADGSEA